MPETETRTQFRQEHRQLPAPDTAFLSGMLQMLAAMYCRLQYPDEPTNEPKKEEPS